MPEFSPSHPFEQTNAQLKSEVVRQERLVQQALRDRDAWKARATSYEEAMLEADNAVAKARGHLAASLLSSNASTGYA